MKSTKLNLGKYGRITQDDLFMYNQDPFEGFVGYAMFIIAFSALFLSLMAM